MPWWGVLLVAVGAVALACLGWIVYLLREFNGTDL
jgi:hypothetical protein